MLNFPLVNIFVVIVTYGERFGLLKKVIDACLNQGVVNIIVVDNNASFDAKSKLAIYEEQLSGIVKVVSLPENLGSAGGFKAGLEATLRIPECQYIWLLDDDTEPAADALERLIDFWIANNCGEDPLLLVSLREDRPKYYESIARGDPSILIGKYNSFLTFDVFDRVKARIARTPPYIDKRLPGITSGDLLMAPYGGMFLQKSILSLIGLPDERYVVYTDDTEFSHRVVKAGGRIIAVVSSILKDVESSWNNEVSSDDNHDPILDAKDSFRVYYFMRNRVHFELKHRVGNYLIYGLNCIAFFARLTFLALRKGRFQRLRLCVSAVYDGMRSRLGKKEALPNP